MKYILLLLWCVAVLTVSAAEEKPADKPAEKPVVKKSKLVSPRMTVNKIKLPPEPERKKAKKSDKSKTQQDDKKEAKKEEKKEEKKDDSPTPSGPQTDGDFRKVILDADQKVGEKFEDTLKDPMELSVAADGRVFFIERGGTLKLWKPESKKSTVVGKLNVFTELEDGLLGITLDPNFLQNGWIYLNYSLPQTGKDKSGKKIGTNRVSRFTFSADKLDLTTEKVLLEIQTQREQCCHSGGSLTFDANGNLFISTGDNTNPFDSDGFAPIDERRNRGPWDAQKSAANESDLRGKVLRIHPEADGTYTIPKGNLFDQAKRESALLGVKAKSGGALLVANSAKPPRPEVFVMGCRNPFRISVDKKTGYLYWGDVGPDAKEFKENAGPGGMDEVNQARTAGYFGWPYFVAENKPYWKRNFSAPTNVVPKLKFNATKPENFSINNTGPHRLPPAQPAFVWYGNGPSVKFPVVNGEGGRTAMAGPVYYYDPNLKSEHKLPKEFDHTLFIYDWSRSWVIAVHLDKDNKIEKMERFCSKMSFKRPVDLELGPDGCLYMIEWGTGWGNNKDSQLIRLEYAPSNNGKPADAPKK